MSQTENTGHISTSHDAPPVYYDGDVLVIRASAIMSCTKMLAGIAFGYERMATPEKTQARFDDGHLHEDSILRAVERQKDVTIVPDERTLVLRVHKGLEIRGHNDGRYLAPLGGYGLAEAKAFSKLNYQNWLAKGMKAYPYYAYQVAIYWYAVNAQECLFAVKNKDSGEVDVTTITEAPVSLGTIYKRALEIEKAVKGAVEGGQDPALLSCDLPSYPCSLYYLHEEKVEKTFVDDEVLRDLVQQRAQEQTAEAAAKKQKEILDEEIRMRLTHLGEDSITFGDGWSVTQSVGSTSKMNLVKLKEDFPSLDLEKYKVKVPNSRASVTVTAPKKKTTSGDD